MPKSYDYRPRLSIDLPEDLFNKLNDLLGEWRIKNHLYRKITEDLVKAMEKMDATQRRFFIVSILSGEVEAEQYIKSIKDANSATEKFKKVDT